MKQNGPVDLQNSIVAINTHSLINSKFLPLLWQHSPRALLFCSEFKPEAVMVSMVEKIGSGWRFPETTIPMLPEIYVSELGDCFTSPLVRMVNQSDVCLSFKFDQVDDKLLMARYRQEFNLDPDDAIFFNGWHEECQWLEYQLLIRHYCNDLEDDQHGCLFNVEDYLEYLKTPEDRLIELCGCGFQL